MIEALYEWIRQIAYYLILVTAVMQAAAKESYRKYIRLFTGTVLVLMILSPVSRFLTEEGEGRLSMAGEEYEEAVLEMEETIRKMEREYGVEEPEAEEEKEEEESPGQIEVEEIRIGR